VGCGRQPTPSLFVWFVVKKSFLDAVYLLLLKLFDFSVMEEAKTSPWRPGGWFLVIKSPRRQGIGETN
jgi:hypothetical protein